MSDSLQTYGIESTKLSVHGILQARIMEWGPVVLVVKNLSVNIGDLKDSSLIPGSGRFPGRGHGNLLQYSCLGNPMDRGAWQARIHGVAKSWT